MLESFVIKLQALLKGDFNTVVVFFVKFAKFLRTLFFTEHLQWLLLTVSGFQPATLLKKTKMFFCEFAKFLRTSFDKTHPVNASGVYQ